MHPPRPLRSQPCPSKTRADLEWQRVLNALADRCAGPLGRRLAAELPFAETREGARAWLAEAAEAAALVRAGVVLPLAEGEGIPAAIDRVRIGGVLSPAELRNVGHLLDQARSLRHVLTSRKLEAPSLFRACATDASLDEIAAAIREAFDADGTLADRASPRLRELRAEWHAARQRMLSRMQELVRRHEEILQDTFVTEREGRWVLPVRSDAHERFPGIVHATSGSGATLFIEPRAVVGMGNRLKVLEADVRREEEAVYAELTTRVADALASVEAARDAMALADVRVATARLARELDLVFVDVVDEPRMVLTSARHPLLVLDFMTAEDDHDARHAGDGGPSRRVVPSDLSIEAGKAMVISGPNAGGKTVALKTMGLAALSVRSGLPVACAETSVVGLFDVVLTDVGDDQSIHKNLSTFSAHVANLAAVLEETSAGTLVLLDELAGGTDPREGEALAAGVLDSLCARGGAVAVTTHYEGLKALALGDRRFVNASVGFDLARMEPTFELAVGVPGRSSALAVARRFGMPSTVIERAERFLAREDLEFEVLVRRLNDERAALELARSAAEERERQASAAAARWNAAIESRRREEAGALSEQARELMSRLLEARAQLRDAQARLRSKRPDSQTLRDAERAIEEVARDVAIGGALEPIIVPDDRSLEQHAPIDAATLRKGQRVWVPRLRAEADVLEVIGDGDVRVAAGPLKLTVAASELRTVQETSTPASPAFARVPSRPTAPAAARRDGTPFRARDNTCDLRGLRVDDAIAMANSFLDRAVGGGTAHVFLLHGHGTGALRDALRKNLARSPYVARIEAAAPEAGGDAVTIVWLA